MDKSIQLKLVDENPLKKSDTPKDTWRTSKELIIAVSGPSGCGHEIVISELETQLKQKNYNVHHIKLSRYISDAQKIFHILEPRDNSENRYIVLQDAGNKMREKFGNSVLAQVASAAIAGLRAESYEQRNSSTRKNNNAELKKSHTNKVEQFDASQVEPNEKIAYIVDQLKHPEEASLLRSVYGNAFVLIGVFSSAEERIKRLKEDTCITEHSDAYEIMERDKNQNISHGQKLEKTLQLADYFISTQSNDVSRISVNCKRLLDLIHGTRIISPSQDEYGMFIAYSSGLRSACLSRQVGAAILDESANVISTGCNDVPKPGGGLYGDDQNSTDGRCFNKSKECSNDKQKEKLSVEFKKQIASLLISKLKAEDVDTLSNEIAAHLAKFTRVKDLIEFSRSVHAEMDAIVSVARKGGGSVKGANLYTTVFPCHNCARHIIAAGIKRVVFIEPYEKSLAITLHDDAITISDVAMPKNSGESNKVIFQHFEGVAPRKYTSFFNPTRERKKDGRLIVSELHNEISHPQIVDSYTDIEAKIVKIITTSELKKVLVKEED